MSLYNIDIIGTWALQQNIYYFKKKNIYTIQEELEIIIKNDSKHNESKDKYIIKYMKSSDNNSTLYLLTNELEVSPIMISKNNHGQKSKYTYKKNKKNILKLQMFKKNIEYTEYLYNINRNFNISISLMQTINTKQYIGIAFTSYIKKIKN